MHKRTKKRTHIKEKFADKLLIFIFYPIRIFLYYFLFQFIFRILFRFGHKVKYNKNGFKLPKTPFLVLGNHVSDWDGLYLNTYLKRFIYFLVHDEVFKYWYRKIIAYNILGQIKRGKTKNDIWPLKKLLSLRDSGKCIGIFPEGDISYSGRSLTIDKSISKFCKILAMPIVLTRLDGATFARPRWSYKARKYPISLTQTDVISADEVKSLSNEALYERILNGISYNDNEYQKVHKHICRANNIAEKLEHVLFLCPDCNNINCMESKGENFTCKVCGYSVRYNSFCRFELLKGKNCLCNISEWDDYQKNRLPDIIKKYAESGKEILSFDNFTYNKVPRGNFFYKHQYIGTLSINTKRLKFVSFDGAFKEEYNIQDINDLYIQFKGAVEFTVGDYRYRFISRKGQHYGYWYECIINSLKNSFGE